MAGEFCQIYFWAVINNCCSNTVKQVWHLELADNIPAKLNSIEEVELTNKPVFLPSKASYCETPSIDCVLLTLHLQVGCELSYHLLR